MRFPDFTAEAGLPESTTTSWAGRLVQDSGTGSRPVAPQFTSCLRQCLAGGADGCGPFCACHAAGGTHCPTLF